MPTASQVTPVARRSDWLHNALTCCSIVSALGLLTVGIAMRWINLDHLPGINGDEAWYGVQAQRVLQGEPVVMRTPTGNLLNPFYFGPLLLVHQWLEPSGFALRCVAAASGTLLLLVNFALCRESLGQTTAVVSTVLLAILPINVAYSRFGWDASQSVLFTAAAIHCSLIAIAGELHRTCWLASAVLLSVASTVVHPTNIFVVIFPAAALIWPSRHGLLLRLRAIWRQRSNIAGGSQFAIVALLVTAIIAAILALPPTYRHRLLNGEQYFAFALLLGRLLSGNTVYQFISGSSDADPPGNLPSLDGLQIFDLIGWTVTLAGIYGLWRWRRRLGDAEAVLLVSTSVLLLAFYLAAGPFAIVPHFERYALCLIAPMALVVSRGACWWVASPHDRFHCGRLATSSLGWLIVGSVWLNYFAHIQSTGGESHATFRTSNTEPKQSALRLIETHLGNGSAATIVVHEWWTYWPLAYLAGDCDNIHVAWWSDLSNERRQHLVTQRSLWAVEFADSTGAIEAESLFATEAGTPETVTDPRGRPILRVYGPAKNSSQKNSSPRFDKPGS